MCEDQYLPNEFNYIIYQASSGGLSCPDSDARISWYNISGFPTLQFDGGWYQEVGAAASVVDGVHYMEVIDSHRDVSAPLAVIVSDYSFEGAAFAEVTVKMFDDINPSNHKIRVAVIENNLAYGGTVYQATCRDIIGDVPLTVSANGEEQIENFSIPMNGSWNVNELKIIAFVQNDGNKYIVNSGNSDVGEYAAVASVDGPRQVIADGAQVTFDNTNIINIGLESDTFDVSVDTSALPDGWAAHLSYDGGEYQTFPVTLDPYDMATFNVVMDTGEVGSGRVVVNIASQGGGEIIESLDFVALAGGTDLLIISDDAGAGHAYDVYGPAVGATGKSYAIWDNSLAQVSEFDLEPYEGVIWQSGNNQSTLNSDDRDALNAYLADGGALILAGNDILESLYIQGGSARLWYQLKLRINYSAGTSGDLNVNGVLDDPIGDGLAFTLTGGDPDVMTLFSGQPVWATFEYGNGAIAGARTEYGG